MLKYKSINKNLKKIKKIKKTKKTKKTKKIKKSKKSKKSKKNKKTIQTLITKGGSNKAIITKEIYYNRMFEDYFKSDIIKPKNDELIQTFEEKKEEIYRHIDNDKLSICDILANKSKIKEIFINTVDLSKLFFKDSYNKNNDTKKKNQMLENDNIILKNKNRINCKDKGKETIKQYLYDTFFDLNRMRFLYSSYNNNKYKRDGTEIDSKTVNKYLDYLNIVLKLYKTALGIKLEKNDYLNEADYKNILKIDCNCMEGKEWNNDKCSLFSSLTYKNSKEEVPEKYKEILFYLFVGWQSGIEGASLFILNNILDLINSNDTDYQIKTISTPERKIYIDNKNQKNIMIQDFTAMFQGNDDIYHKKLFRTYIICSMKDNYNYIYITRNYDTEITDTKLSFEEFYQNQTQYTTEEMNNLYQDDSVHL